jgi:hypothetical protein
MASTASDLITQFHNTDRPGTQGMSRIHQNHGRKRVKQIQVIPVVGDGAGHLYRLARMKAHDAITSIKIANSADAGLTDCNIGPWTPAADASTDPVTLSANDALCDGLNIAAGAAIPAEVLGTGSDPAVTEFGQRIFEMAGLTEPANGTEYEIVMQSVGNPAGCNVFVQIEYIAGD